MRALFTGSLLVESERFLILTSLIFSSCLSSLPLLRFIVSLGATFGNSEESLPAHTEMLQIKVKILIRLRLSLITNLFLIWLSKNVLYYSGSCTIISYKIMVLSLLNCYMFLPPVLSVD